MIRIASSATRFYRPNSEPKPNGRSTERRRRSVRVAAVGVVPSPEWIAVRFALGAVCREKT